MQLLHEYFEKSARLFPDKAAVQCGESVFIYGTIEKNANRLAHIFQKHGAKPEVRIAILLPRNEWLYCSMLAVLKAGAAYLPLDPETPIERINYILDDADIKFIITTNELAAKVSNKAKILYLEKIIPEALSEPASRIPTAETGVNPENLCYVIYTSGTTGRPKGVMVEHRNVVSLVETESNIYGIKPEDRIFQFASPAFDASIEEIWMAFANGAALIAGTPDIIRSGPDFSEHLERLGITVLSCVPTYISMLDKDISTLRMLIFGGRNVLQRFPPAGISPAERYLTHTALPRPRLLQPRPCLSRGNLLLSGGLLPDIRYICLMQRENQFPGEKQASFVSRAQALSAAISDSLNLHKRNLQL